MNKEDVDAIFRDQLRIAKPFIKAGHIVANDKGELPEMWTGYARSAMEREGIRPHIEYGVFPDLLFANRAPNQTEEEFLYIKANYAQTTLPVFEDMENTLGRGMSPGNWSIDYAENAKPFQDHIEGGLREWGSLWNFFKNGVLRPKIADPMGVLTFLPTEIPVVEDEEGNVRIDPEAELKPDVQYYECERVWGFDYDRWYLVRLASNSVVEEGNTKSYTGVVCLLIDEEKVWRIEQVGKASEWTFEINDVYEHMCGFAPCIHLMGVHSVSMGKMVWKSPYLAAKGNLDRALTNEQYLQGIVAKVIYPHKVVIGDECGYFDNEHRALCENGFLSWSEGEGEKAHPVLSPCPKCDARKKAGGVFSVTTVKPVNLNSGDSGTPSTINATNALAFVSPPTDSPRFIEQYIANNMAAARKILHVDAETPMAGGDAKTATEAGLNAKARDAFAKSIIDQIFVQFAFGNLCFAKQMGYTEDAFSLTAPTSYDLRSADDYLAGIEKSTAAGLPPSLLGDQLARYTDVKYRGDEVSTKKFDAIRKADMLLTVPTEDIMAGVSAGQIEPWEQILHRSADTIYEYLTDFDPAFVNMEAKDQALKLIERAKVLAEPKKREPITARLAVVPNDVVNA